MQTPRNPLPAARRHLPSRLSQRQRSPARRLATSVAAVTLAAVLLTLSSCATVTSSHSIQQMTNRDTAELTAQQVVEVMERAGFSEREIIANGPELRNALATSGAAQIQRNRGVDSMFVVEGARVHVSARNRGAFVFDLNTSQPQE